VAKDTATNIDSSPQLSWLFDRGANGMVRREAPRDLDVALDAPLTDDLRVQTAAAAAGGAGGHRRSAERERVEIGWGRHVRRQARVRLRWPGVQRQRHDTRPAGQTTQSSSEAN
jgi:hypothetical protein